MEKWEFTILNHPIQKHISNFKGGSFIAPHKVLYIWNLVQVSVFSGLFSRYLLTFIVVVNKFQATLWEFYFSFQKCVTGVLSFALSGSVWEPVSADTSSHLTLPLGVLLLFMYLVSCSTLWFSFFFWHLLDWQMFLCPF